MNRIPNAQRVACKHKHNIGQGHHKRSDTQSTTSIDVATCKNESFSSNAVKNGDIAEIMGKPSTWWKDFLMLWSWKQVTWILLLWSKIIMKPLQKDDFTNGLTIMTHEMIIPIYLQNRMNRGAHTRSRVTIAYLNSPKLNTIGN